MDKRIQDFISEQSVFTICTSVNNEPYCASCMYAYIQEEHKIIFSSETKTRHIREALVNTKVAGTILPGKIETGIIRGLQFTGSFQNGSLTEKAEKIYYSKYPFALIMKGELWTIELKSIKMTDNTLGFGKKILWNEDSEIKGKIAE